MVPRIVPFAAYVLFMGIEQGLYWLSPHIPVLVPWRNMADPWLYSARVAVPMSLLVYFWPKYEELKGKAFKGKGEVFLSIAVGAAVYWAWVRMDWAWATQGELSGYDPFRAGEMMGLVVAAIRIAGAAAVVPVMEELFWRSFLPRYFISVQFDKIPLGAFTPVSFLATIVLFGMEHQLWLAGIMAGAAYNMLLYKTGRLWPCILAHGTTNLVLGAHVLVTGEWHWW